MATRSSVLERYERTPSWVRRAEWRISIPRTRTARSLLTAIWAQSRTAIRGTYVDSSVIVTDFLQLRTRPPYQRGTIPCAANNSVRHNPDGAIVGQYTAGRPYQWICRRPTTQQLKKGQVIAFSNSKSMRAGSAFTEGSERPLSVLHPRTNRKVDKPVTNGF